MNTDKQTLIESINKQRKLMGLDEIMTSNIDALKEMEPEDDDESGMDDLPIELDDDHYDYDDERSDDERDFYRGQEPMSLDDLLDKNYPDPNEREWQANRYGSEMNEAELDELFGTGIGAGITGALKGIGQNFKSSRVTQQIKNSEAKFAKVIAQANEYLNKNEKIFNELMAHQKTLASLNTNDPNKKALEAVLTNSKATWNTLKQTLSNAAQQINKAASATTPASGQTSTGTTQNTPVMTQSGQTAPASINVGDKVEYKGKQYTVSGIPSPGNVTLPGINAAIGMNKVQKV